MRHTAHKINNRLNTSFALLGGLALLGTSGCLDMTPAELEEGVAEKNHTYSSQVILDWSAHAENAMVVDSGNIDPLPATRLLSMVHIAQHDAINAVDSIFDKYAYSGGDSGAHPVAAAAAAAHRVLVRQFPAQAADLDAKLAASLAAVPDGSSETRGVTLGSSVGNFIFDLRANDGAAESASFTYTPGTGAGKYQLVPPLAFVNRPGWHFVTPFVLQSADQFRSAARPSLSSGSYATAYNEVKSVGILNSTTRTADQTSYAKFWYENSDTGWNRITRTVTVSKGLKLYSAARLFALVNMAMADGFIAGWDSKFFYDFWRPYTAIRAGSTDGNGATAEDPNWLPLMDTPPVQDYPSTHSVLGAAAAEVLGDLLGDNTSFTFTSSTAVNPMVDTRSFTSFSQAAAENADSRVRAGIHFRFSCNAGLTMGELIGNYAVANYLRFD
jgi:hypothetical protein